jgi:hypothetical protein
MTNSKIKKILSKIEHIKNQLNTNDKVTKAEETKEFKTKALKVLEKTLNYLEEK